jgi:Rod binding domain-containing protein
VQVHQFNQQLSAVAAAPSSGPRLAHAAHEFEASLMGELLKPMEKVNGLNGEDEQEEGSGGALADFATESLARAISERGGFGIADRVLQELRRSTGATAHDASPRPLNQS